MPLLKTDTKISGQKKVTAVRFCVGAAQMQYNFKESAA